MSQRSGDKIQLLPLSPYQNHLIEELANPNTSNALQDYNILRWAFLVKPKADERRMRRAFDKLTQRHDSLRLRIVKNGNDYKAEIQPKHPIGLIVEDLGEMSREDLVQAVQERASKPLSIFSDALFEMRLLRFGKSGDVMLTRVQHAICDAYSIVLIIEEFLKFIINLPVLKDPASHLKFVQSRLRDRNLNEDKNTAFWNKQMLPLGSKPNIGRSAKGLAPLHPGNIGPTIGIRDILLDDEMKTVTAHASSTRLTTFNYLYAAFGDALCQIANVDECMICNVVGRNDTALSAFVGAEMQLLTLKYEYQPNFSLDEKARYVAKLIQGGIEHLPTKAFRPGQKIHDALEESGRTLKQFFVHVPQSPARMKSSPFAKAFSNALSSKLKVGFFEVEFLDVDDTVQTDFELDFSLKVRGDVWTASLIGNAEGYAEEDILNISRGIRRNLGLTSDDDWLEDRIFRRGGPE